MLKFTPVTLNDIEKLRPFLAENPNRLSDFTIGGVFMWRDYLRTEYCIEDNSLYLKAHYPVESSQCCAFCIPIGGDVEKGIDKITEYCRSLTLSENFFAVTEAQLRILKERFSFSTVIGDRDSYDYLYNASDMVSFSGKKFNGQRNHINKFRRTYPDYVFEDISAANIDNVRDFCMRFSVTHDKHTAIAHEENRKIAEVLDNFEAYGFFGGVVAVGGQIIAVSVGENAGDTLYIHIEKANIEYAGAYQVIVNEFAKRFVTDGTEYINREDDVGDEGLRTSKLSYQPIALLEKYILHL